MQLFPEQQFENPIQVGAGIGVVGPYPQSLLEMRGGFLISAQPRQSDAPIIVNISRCRHRFDRLGVLIHGILELAQAL
jgi:hypothetical protein